MEAVGSSSLLIMDSHVDAAKAKCSNSNSSSSSNNSSAKSSASSNGTNNNSSDAFSYYYLCTRVTLGKSKYIKCVYVRQS